MDQFTISLPSYYARTIEDESTTTYTTVSGSNYDSVIQFTSSRVDENISVYDMATLHLQKIEATLP